MEKDIKHLYTVIEQVQRAYSWMLESIVHKAEESQGGNYSDELKHAILTGELLETVEIPKDKNDRARKVS